MKTTAALLTLLLPTLALAKPSGMSGRSGRTPGATCNSCHSGGAAPTVQLTGPTTLAAGETGAYQLVITGGAAVVGGLNVATSGGTLVASGPGTRLADGELTQDKPVPFTGGALTFTFELTAPDATGTVTLFAAGNSADGDGKKGGDAAGLATLAVSVADPATPSPRTTPQGGCSASGRAPAASWAWLAAALWLCVRARRGLTRDRARPAAL